MKNDICVCNVITGGNVDNCGCDIIIDLKDKENKNTNDFYRCDSCGWETIKTNHTDKLKEYCPNC